MTEVPSPLTFKKNIIVWTDDNPQNNVKIIDTLEKKEIEVMQLVSTKISDIWVREFGWFLNWKEIKYKIVTDMVRTEEENDNYYAGIDLLEKLFNEYGFTAPILIYCGDTETSPNKVSCKAIP